MMMTKLSRWDRLWSGVIVALAVGALSAPPSVVMAADPPARDSSHGIPDWGYGQNISNRWDAYSLGPFLPNRTGDFILPWESLESQVFEGLGVAPLSARQLENGRRLLWGCRRHSCSEMAAVVVSPDGKVEAVAMIHAGCHFTAFPVRRNHVWRKSNFSCNGDPMTLTVFLHVSQTWRPAFERWAEAMTGERLPLEIYWV